MLGEPEHRQVDQLAALASDYWRGVFPEDAAIRDALVRHLRALFQAPQGVRALSLDRQQVERSRASLRTAELPVLVYGAIRLALGNAGSEDGKRQGPRLDRQLGLLGEVYERRSGVPLSEPLPYLFTRAGFQELAGGGLDAAVRQFLADDWVLGSTQLDPLARSQLARQVMALYQRDYIQAWDGLLEDLQLRPVSGMAEASAVAAKLGGPGSPLKAMMELVQAHTSGLTSAPPAAPAAADKPAAAAEEGGGGAPAAAQPPDPLAAPIERHFEPINRLSVDGGGGTQLQQITSSLTQVGRSLLTMSAGAAGAGVDQNDPSLLLAAQQAQQLPMPLAAWISGLVGQSRTLVADNTGELLRSRQQQAAGQDCALFVNGRYPFRPDSRSDIPLRDFAELFGPGGRFDRFFQQALADKAQTSGRQWQWNRQMQDVSATDVLTRAQLADHVQQAFFAGGGAMPKVDFTASIASQAELGRIELEIDGQVLEAKGQAPASLSMSWPGPQSGQLRLSAWDTAGRPLPPVQYRGVWAMFRALDAGRLRAVGDLRYRADFEVGDAVVSVDIQPASLRHPFADTALQRFRCP
jgi:type VI secretion system protein ImpL